MYAEDRVLCAHTVVVHNMDAREFNTITNTGAQMFTYYVACTFDMRCTHLCSIERATEGLTHTRIQTDIGREGSSVLLLLLNIDSTHTYVPTQNVHATIASPSKSFTHQIRIVPSSEERSPAITTICQRNRPVWAIEAPRMSECRRHTSR